MFAARFLTIPGTGRNPWYRGGNAFGSNGYSSPLIPPRRDRFSLAFARQAGSGICRSLRRQRLPPGQNVPCRFSLGPVVQLDRTPPCAADSEDVRIRALLRQPDGRPAVAADIALGDARRVYLNRRHGRCRHGLGTFEQFARGVATFRIFGVVHAADALLSGIDSGFSSVLSGRDSACPAAVVTTAYRRCP